MHPYGSGIKWEGLRGQMVVQAMSVKDFRNFDELHLTLNRGLNIFYGDNGRGKTNFLESVYLSATGRSQRAASDRELIRFGQREAHVRALISEPVNKAGCMGEQSAAERSARIDIHLKREEKKGVAVNGLPIKKMSELFGVLFVVIFSPDDLSLVKAGPSVRRYFMDMELCQLSPVYYYQIQQYYRVLKQRNNLLKELRKKHELLDTVELWDEQLTEHGMRIMEYRRDFVERIGHAAADIHGSITNRQERLEIMYRPNAEGAFFRERLKKNLERDILLGSTSVGIHKDDMLFNINGSDARSYGSQGQQRCASLAAKLAEITIIREEKGTSPVLLLDDVLSELDKTRQAYLLETVQSIQAIITCAGVEDAVKKITSNAAVFHVRSKEHENQAVADIHIK